MTDIIQSILAINPNAEVSVNAEDIKQITWHNGTTPIAEADILAKQAELQAKREVEEKRLKKEEAERKAKEEAENAFHDKSDTIDYAKARTALAETAAQLQTLQRLRKRASR